MANLNNMPSLSSQKGFSMHDLSHYFGFKCSTGHIVPLECDILNPNERVRLKADMFVRMQPLVTPAMVDIDVDIHYFFVPLQMLDINFGRKWSQTREIFTSIIGGSQLSDKDLIRFCIGTSFTAYRTYFHEEGTAGFSGYSSSNTLECYGSRIFRLFDYFGLNPYVLLKDSPNFFDTDAQTVVQAIEDNGDPRNVVRQWNNTFDPYLFFYQILAYNAIWQYWYRLEDRDMFDNKFFNLDRFYTANTTDIVADNLFNGDTQHTAKMLDLFGIKYAPNRKDYFTSTFRAPVINGLNFLQGNTNDLFTMLNDGNENRQFLTDTAFHPSVVGNASESTSINSGAPTIVKNQDSLEFNTQQLRLMQAKEKYMNILGRLPRKNYDNLVYALFGENVPHDIKHELSHLGHDHFTINIGQVTSTASTDGAPLGELAGTGVGSSKSKGIKFTAPVHGIIMAVASIVPRRMYLGGLLRHNYITTLNDFYNPVYDNLGMQPIFSFELSNEPLSAAEFTPDTTLCGWQFRYEQFKRRYDRVNHAFDYGTEKAWFNTSSIMRLRQIDNFDPSQSGEYTVLTSPQNDFFYCRPDSLNNIMLVQYSVNWIEQWLTAARREETGNPDLVQADLENWYFNPSLIYARDPFICLSHIDYTKFSKMSDYGLVRFD